MAMAGVQQPTSSEMPAATITVCGRPSRDTLAALLDVAMAAGLGVIVQPQPPRVDPPLLTASTSDVVDAEPARSVVRRRRARIVPPPPHFSTLHASTRTGQDAPGRRDRRGPEAAEARCARGVRHDSACDEGCAVAATERAGLPAAHATCGAQRQDRARCHLLPRADVNRAAWRTADGRATTGRGGLRVCLGGEGVSAGHGAGARAARGAIAE